MRAAQIGHKNYISYKRDRGKKLKKKKSIEI
jgi:hypothetical protein